MASPRVRRLISVASASTELNDAIRARRRLQEEAIKLNRSIVAAGERLTEIDKEETILSDSIERYAGMIAKAHAEPEA